MDTLSGSVERITFYNPENGYTVLRLKPDQRGLSGLSREGLATVIGNLPKVTPGEHLRLAGRWTRHPKHGLQFQAETCEKIMPATVAGIRRYLGSGLIKGIGPRLADRIVATFGAETLRVIEEQPNRLLEVPDIGPKRARRILEAWEEQKQIKEIMLFLHGHGVSTNLAVKIYKTYGDQAISIVQQDPYRLAQDIRGVGFKTADRIAQALGLSPEHPTRLETGILFALNQALDDGHVFVPRAQLLEQAADLLQVDVMLLKPALERLISREMVRAEQVPVSPEEHSSTDPGTAESAASYRIPAVYLTPFHVAERGLAERLRELMSASTSRSSRWLFLPDRDLSEQQLRALETALREPVSVLTGGPGTGKTTAIRALIAALEGQKRRYALAAPTGRAAKRLSEATDRPASTIHRLLGYKPGEGFKHHEENPLPVDFLVVDEASMIDLLLAYHLVKALAPGAHLLLVGDVDQLPSVGAGDVLRQIIASGRIPVTRLTTIFRQAADSLIIANAHRINQGNMPIFPKEAQDFFLFPAEDPEKAADWVVDVVVNRIPRRFGLRPMEDIQVLAPMYRGDCGVNALNQRLQATLNPPAPNKPEKDLFGFRFRVGDRVMQTENNYDHEVYNGDLGRIVALSLVDHTLTVDFDGRRVTYDWSECDQLTPAYAISVHKSQGAEFPAVVMPVLTQHYIMLQRNLLYTAITRARKLCVLVGSKRAIAIAVRNNPVVNRYTSLAWRLQRT